MASREETGFAIDRRTALIGAACCCVAGPVLAQSGEGMPAEGDKLVFMEGELEGKLVTGDKLTVGGEPVVAVPADASGAAKTGSRFNKIVLVRMAPEDISEDIKDQTADGVIALSAICTHSACTVNGWNKDDKALLCFCHGSQFYPGQGGKVAKGPARKRLPILPVKAGENNTFVVAGPLAGKPGPGAA